MCLNPFGNTSELKINDKFFPTSIPILVFIGTGKNFEYKSDIYNIYPNTTLSAAKFCLSMPSIWPKFQRLSEIFEVIRS